MSQDPENRHRRKSTSEIKNLERKRSSRLQRTDNSTRSVGDAPKLERSFGERNLIEGVEAQKLEKMKPLQNLWRSAIGLIRPANNKIGRARTDVTPLPPPRAARLGRARTDINEIPGGGADSPGTRITSGTPIAAISSTDSDADTLFQVRNSDIASSPAPPPSPLTRIKKERNLLVAPTVSSSMSNSNSNRSKSSKTKPYKAQFSTESLSVSSTRRKEPSGESDMRRRNISVSKSFTSTSKSFVSLGLRLSVSRLERQNINEGEQKDLERFEQLGEVNHHGALRLDEDVLKIQRLGEGSSGIVHLGIYVPTLRLVAVKEQNIGADLNRFMEEFAATYRQLVPLSQDPFSRQQYENVKADELVNPCPYLIDYYGAHTTVDKMKVSLVMEYMDAGSLERVVKGGGVQSEVVLQRIAYCCLKGLDHLHQHMTIHRDIKPANILMRHDGIVKIADLGLATRLKTAKSQIRDQCGSRDYFSPERIVSEPYGLAADIWSLGASFLALILGHHPFSTKDKVFGILDQVTKFQVERVLQNVSGGIRDLNGKESKTFSKEFVNFMTKMMHKDPKRRWSTRDLLQHAFFKSKNGIPEDDSFGPEHGLRAALAFADIQTGQRSKPFQEEWNRTIGSKNKDGKKLLKKLRAKIWHSPRYSAWFATTVRKMRSRSQHELPKTESVPVPLDSSPGKLAIAVDSKSKLQNSGDSLSGPNAASTDNLDRKLELRKSTTEAIGSGVEVQRELWLAFRNIAGAVGLPLKEVVKELKDIHAEIDARGPPRFSANTESLSFSTGLRTIMEDN
mmetsp:Transcript_6220/g.14994  ORF Transcript_6220/g.14994 Transcript_6220/m.14994 type:complete len:792 (-) Transcript_6220:332-2707(-)|eukprot:CAMPEP_0114489086 /NCGR_PEP_ID=MMETSP0109-20121206/1691_1 /TAXON_ID=29199 /ORGANISM="Chlorarachnion reptans, Strain CCCM449" /LENGTH=791 /DNA_ID=CAMNT_0001665553 /DNA_START=50 /DNA_END=2425 /DNA_ORIENTATION=+